MRVKKLYIPSRLRKKVQKAAQGICAYCLSEERLMGVTFEIDHIQPIESGGKTTLRNLCLSCPSCNRYKGKKTDGLDIKTGKKSKLFNPNKHIWREHFSWSKDSTRILGLTLVGRATVESLRMNRAQIVEIRRYWSATKMKS